MEDFDSVHARLHPQGWRTIWLRYFGKRVPQRSREMSESLARIINHPLVYNASISILEPGGGIPLHVGQCRGLVKLHLPVSVPEGECYMLYNGKKFYWTSPMIFDDTLPHLVSNQTSETRVIILLDILRPMNFPWDILNSRIASLVWWDPVVSQRYKRIARSSLL